MKFLCRANASSSGTIGKINSRAKSSHLRTKSLGQLQVKVEEDSGTSSSQSYSQFTQDMRKRSGSADDLLKDGKRNVQSLNLVNPQSDSLDHLTIDRAVRKLSVQVIASVTHVNFLCISTLFLVIG